MKGHSKNAIANGSGWLPFWFGGKFNKRLVQAAGTSGWYRRGQEKGDSMNKRNKNHLLKYELSKRGLAQNKVAQAIGISEKALSNKICGRTEFTCREVSDICSVLGIEDPRPVFFPEFVNAEGTV